jgi:hypothetical protein
MSPTASKDNGTARSNGLERKVSTTSCGALLPSGSGMALKSTSARSRSTSRPSTVAVQPG